MTVVKRRIASTETIQHLWDAIVYVRQQKQVPNLERIANYMRRKHHISPEELEKQIEYAVHDTLIEMKKRVGCKGSKVGVEQDTYRIPEKDVEKDGHDWYCFECHKEGEIIYCSTCHRVYHEDCIKESASENEKFVCDACKLVKTKDILKIKKDDLNLLLGYACLRMKEKALNCRELHKMPLTEDEKWRHNYLIFEEMDLTVIEDKTQENAYKSIEEFQVDAQTLVHNIVLYYGVHSTLADTARQMLRDCRYDLGEIRQCRDCYRTSNEKSDRHWFCQPCDPPHELVYAKQKGFPYWPAKVIRVNNGVYDVRFFGGYHQRANIEKDHIKPITTSLQQLQLKRSAGLNKALEELKRHQQLLGQTPAKDLSPKKNTNKKERSRPRSTSSSRSNSGSRSRSRKGSVSSEAMSENEVEDGNSSQDECPSSSSPKQARFKDAPTPEDHNVVSSSCQESSPCAKVTVSTQTHKKLLASLIPPKPVKPEEKEIPPCDCEQKYSKMFKEFKERLEAEQKEEKERSLRELAERLRQDFEEEKQRVVSAAMEKVEQDLGEEKRKSEDQLRSAQQMEVSEIMERHRMEVSEIKKKQWCYNCEAEAIYHCCWNTSYCSVDCQQVHWHKEHKRTCRRKR
ncbi:zinc finger MYND domain-containing protein 11-like [Uloborus diversus]|uniref:zinc finger MYND domain-containing protein 11-like n=1 Tax=Uloborus diversus TaxID=327109 RepID=UPI00240A3A77|nr:zinc finger MYND domain-containing protein 11-like [Uloborus diversus]